MDEKNTEKKPKVGIYVRVSTEEQAKEGISIDAQIERCKAFCISKDWDIGKIYTDAGYSAGTMDRPAFRDLINDINFKRINIVLVYKIDRFSRNLKDLILLLESMKDKNVNFSSVTEQIDTTTAMGEAFFQIIGVFAQLERGMVRERVEMAFGKKISQGDALQRAPLGYRYSHKKLVIDHENADKVRSIFDMKSKGISPKEISAVHKIAISTIYNIVKNPTYIGKIQYKGQLYKANHLPLIKEDLFFKINPKSES